MSLVFLYQTHFFNNNMTVLQDFKNRDNYTQFFLTAREWQLNELSNDLTVRKIINYKLYDNSIKRLLVLSSSKKESVVIAQLSTLRSVLMSKVDYVPTNDGNHYYVYSEDITEDCLHYAVANNMLEEEFVHENEYCTKISKKLMHLCGYLS